MEKKQAGKTEASQGSGQPPPEPPDSDYLLDAALENWSEIQRLYRLYEDRKPVMLYDIQEKRIYAYPYQDFKADLNEPSQRTLDEQYERALGENKMLVFVRDNEKQRLVSYPLELL
jgi:hypothetical protein